MQRRWTFLAGGACAAAAMALWAGHASAAPITLDGVADAGYGAPVATDASGDLATPGPADWSGVAWTDQTALHVTNDATYLYVHSAGNFSSTDSHGSFGLAIDVNNSAAGGSTDPWGNAITFNQASKPDFFVRGNTPADGGWTEFRTFNGTDWNTGGGTNWGGITSGNVGTNIAWADGQGVEMQIPLADLGLAPGNVVNLEFFGTQTGGTKGTYDTVPNDGQSTGWDTPTTENAWASYTIAAVPEPATVGLIGAGALIAMRRRRRRID